ncbi:tetratricopeptide repeat protein [Streptomyces sp. S1D4-11]|nr:tetratricopeptide repeat protein [Streptomyces sp. S1D4-11]
MPPGSPQNAVNWPDWQRVLPHIQATSKHQPDTADVSELSTLLGRAAFYLRARGQAAQALPLQERALQVTEAALGPDHPDTALRLGSLARLRQMLSDGETTSLP